MISYRQSSTSMHARGSCDSKCVICVFSLNRCRQGPGDRRRNGWRPMKPLSGHVAACRRATVVGSSVRSERDQSWGQPPTTRGWVAQCVMHYSCCCRSDFDCTRSGDNCDFSDIVSSEAQSRSVFLTRDLHCDSGSDYYLLSGS